MGSWQEKLKKIDWFGLVVAVMAMVFLLVSIALWHAVAINMLLDPDRLTQLPINSGGSMWPWNNALVISMLCIGTVSWLLFFIIQKHLARLPMIPLGLFTQRSTLILLLQAPAYDFVWQVNLYFLPMYFQQVRGYEPLRAATLLLPLLLTLTVAGSISGPLMTKFARYVSVLYVST